MAVTSASGYGRAPTAPELAAAYPSIRSYTGQGVDHPTATIKIDWNEYGFQAMILSPVSGTVTTGPYAERSMTACMSYYKADYKKRLAPGAASCKKQGKSKRRKRSAG